MQSRKKSQGKVSLPPTGLKEEIEKAPKKRPKIKFFCSNGCMADKPETLLDPHDKVLLIADGIEVFLTFDGDSPFTSGKRTLRIPADRVREQTIAKEPGRSFSYALFSPDCEGRMPRSFSLRVTGGPRTSPPPIVETASGGGPRD